MLVDVVAVDLCRLRFIFVFLFPAFNMACQDGAEDWVTTIMRCTLKLSGRLILGAGSHLDVVVAPHMSRGEKKITWVRG